MLIFHIAREAAWDEAIKSGAYQGDTLIQAGFIHCSTKDQVVDVANRVFKGQNDLVLLCVDSERVNSEIRFENLEGGIQKYPHIYGPLNLNAVVNVLILKPEADGQFVYPD
jgi:uncharacterized protein (DUF952 family)